jgi:hypothetical protein
VDGSLAEQRQRDISPGNVESSRASERVSEQASERAGKTESIRAEGSRDGRMKGDEVEGWGKRDAGERHTLEVAKRRKGARAEDRGGEGA